MTSEQIEILLHTVKNGRYVSDERGDLDALVAAGLLKETQRPWFIPENDRVFVATQAGRDAAWESPRKRPAPPKLTVGQRRYRAWLRVSDVWDVTFGEFLRRGLYREVSP